ncbi:MAG: hypothetical protein ACYDAY_11610 [Candidatus Dormibacteria bacterium]
MSRSGVGSTSPAPGSPRCWRCERPIPEGAAGRLCSGCAHNARQGAALIHNAVLSREPYNAARWYDMGLDLLFCDVRASDAPKPVPAGYSATPYGDLPCPCCGDYLVPCSYPDGQESCKYCKAAGCHLVELEVGQFTYQPNCIGSTGYDMRVAL